MVTELQFIAVAVFLIWGLVASLCGVLTNAPDAAQLVWHHRGSEPTDPTPADDPGTTPEQEPSIEPALLDGVRARRLP
jgi:hypothetical protein